MLNRHSNKFHIPLNCSTRESGASSLSTGILGLVLCGVLVRIENDPACIRRIAVIAVTGHPRRHIARRPMPSQDRSHIPTRGRKNWQFIFMLQYVGLWRGFALVAQFPLGLMIELVARPSGLPACSHSSYARWMISSLVGWSMVSPFGINTTSALWAGGLPKPRPCWAVPTFTVR